TIATDKADGASGDVVLTPDPLAPGRHVLRLSEVVPATGAKLVSVRTAVVDVVKGGVAAVAMLDQGQAMPPAPTVQVATATATASVPVAAKPQAAPAPVPAPAAAPSPFVRLGAVTIGADGQLDVAGAAPPDAHLKLSLNDTFLADATADAGGGFSLSIKTGVVPGKYLLRVEEVDPATGAVLAQAQSAFEYVGEAPKVAAAPAPAAPAPRPAASKTAEAAPSTPAPAKAAEAAPAPAHVVVPAIGARTVVAGDNLWNIAKSTYGDGLAYRKIYAANRDKIRKPRLIFPGQVFVMPEKPAQ
ncbi:MAG: LysM peptidoglycan-binding domain-containing protein, partial [Hyphomicrobiales bacterium]|nr:LysM peptidoglycan-binding domain-containing protein [Hyphomicrobiales bacterium]